MFDIVDIVYQVVGFDRKELRFNNMTNYIRDNPKVFFWQICKE